jgi:hypothetical protein
MIPDPGDAHIHLVHSPFALSLTEQGDYLYAVGGLTADCAADRGMPLFPAASPLPFTRKSGVDLSKSCQRDVPKVLFSGSADAVGRRHTCQQTFVFAVFLQSHRACAHSARCT